MTRGAPPEARVEPRWVALLESLACVALAAMLVLTIGDVFGRYVVARPLKGATELVQYTMVLVVFAGLPVVTARAQHVSVGLLDKVLAGGARRAQLAGVAVTSAAVLAVQAWVLFGHAQAMREAGDVVGALRLPVHPAGYFMALLSALAAAVCVAAVLRPVPAPAPPAH